MVRHAPAFHGELRRPLAGERDASALPSTASRGTRRERPALNDERRPPGERGRPAKLQCGTTQVAYNQRISPNGEILLRRYMCRNGTRSFAHDVV